MFVAQDVLWGNLHHQESVFTIRVVRRSDFNKGNNELYTKLPTATVTRFPAYLTSLMTGVSVENGPFDGQYILDLDDNAINTVRAHYRARHSVAIRGQLLLLCDQSMREDVAAAFIILDIACMYS